MWEVYTNSTSSEWRVSLARDPYVTGDNQSVLFNTSIPESTFKKNTQSIAYHFVSEGAAKDEWRKAYVNTHLNPTDLLTTKPLPSGEKYWKFVGMILHHLPPTRYREV
jgi:hypothetical protein